MPRKKRRRRSSRHALLIEQAEALGELSRRPVAVIFAPVRPLGCELFGIQWRRFARACNAVPGARRKAAGDRRAHDRTSPHGHVVAVHGGHRKGPGALRSGAAVYYGIAAYAQFSGRNYDEAIRLSREGIRQRSDFVGAHRVLTAAAGMAGQTDIASVALQELRRAQPNISLAWIGSQMPIKLDAEREHYLEGFRRAGLE